MRVTITEPCLVEGEHKAVGDIIDVSDNDAMAIVSAGRGTIDKVKGEAAVATAEKAAKAGKAKAE